MPPPGLSRNEFEGYVRRHEDDIDAHGSLVRRLQQEGLTIRLAFESRVGALEQWQQRIIGAVAMLTFLAAAGVITAVVELLRR